jgi:hypothetical protein
MLKEQEGVYTRFDGAKLAPDPGCPSCKGEGEIEVTIPEEKIVAIWVGICPRCGWENGVHIHYQGDDFTDPKNYPFRPSCINDECENDYVEWRIVEQ